MDNNSVADEFYYREWALVTWTRKPILNFKTEILNALKQGADAQDLVAIVHRFKAMGATQRETYDALQDVWLSFGFDDDDHGVANRLRDELEYVMELVWGFCSEGLALWNTTLTNDASKSKH